MLHMHLGPHRTRPAVSLLLGLVLAGSSAGPGLQAAQQKRIVSVRRDADESTHARFIQTVHGVRVWGGDGITHARKDGREFLLTQSVVGEIAVHTSPTLTSSEVLWIVSENLKLRGPFAVTPKVELVILPEVERVHRDTGTPVQPSQDLNAIEVVEKTVGFRLAYHVQAAHGSETGGAALTGFLVDAHGGTILRKWSALETTGTGLSQYSGTVVLSTAPGGLGHELRDVGRGGNVTLDMNHSWDMALNGDLYEDADDVWGDGQQYLLGGSTTAPNGQTAAVDAHFGTQVTWDFYGQVLGRNGIDGAGTPTRARVHFGDNYDNAFWWDECFCLTFGDGSKFKTLTSLDVVGHEFSHGVTFATAGLIYSGESGSLNEATSDILGTMVEFYARGASGKGAVVPDTGGNWTIGEQLSTPAFNHPLRYMYKPSLDGSSPDAWSASLVNLDVHYGSGPMNRCFYFLAQGASANAASVYASPYLPGGMSGLGNDKATRIWYRALTTYLTSASTYLHARMAALRAAIDLYGPGSAEFQAVRNAFAAINVGYASGDGDDLEPPTVSASVDGSTGTIQFTAHAQDNKGVALLVYFVDQRRVATRTLGGQASIIDGLAFDSRSIPKGPHTLTLAATDTVGNVTYSAPVPFQLSNPFYELLLQGDFEFGSLYDGGIDKRHSAWVDPIGVISQAWPYLGWWCGDFCGVGDTNTQSIHQTVTIPAEAQSAVLSFWLEVFSQEPDDRARDTFQVQVRATTGEVLETLATYSNLDRSRIAIPIPAKKDYRQHLLDLSAYRGKTVQLWFEGREDAAHPVPAIAPVAVRPAVPMVVPSPGQDRQIAKSDTISGVTFYPSGVGLSEFLLDNVSLRIGEAPDTEAPVVWSRGIRGTSGVIELSADGQDNLAITRIDFLVDGVLVGTTTSGPHRLSFDSRGLADGNHQLVLNAFDAAGNKGASSPLGFTTDNTSAQILKNPGFEAGLADWTFTNWSVAWSSSIYDTEVETLAGNAGVMGPALPAILSQPVSIPANAASATLTFPYGMLSFSNPPDDSLKVQVRDPSGAVRATLATIAPPNTDAYYGQAEVSLLDFRGQDIVLALVLNTVSLPPGGGAMKGLAVNLTQVDLVVQTSQFPSIFTQPVSCSVSAGTQVTFSVVAGGTGPLSYQWRKDGVDIPGARASSLTIPGAAARDEGSYQVLVTNGQGSVLSAAATLKVLTIVFDLNADGSVNVLDLAWFLKHYAPGVPVANSPADLNADGFVDDADLALLLARL
ncbi:MAG: M4 family metallopeptidase [Geothrix sp.]|uniref:M4 family metallopeptidase n=1 Tax=Geothrix sp. TaxID=1962974 RepID=UPI0017E370CC|nr:M4 family metallopeptidase [Geothrix sp.]NWJ41806.1 M4 family metallopeptidase [Geothrix sp.]WIL20216.1 MAG: M4 family metallopeptidase [Geothrix sp.]